MRWSYRVIRHADGELGIHEVDYDNTGNIENCTEAPISGTFESIDDVRTDLEHMLDALNQPVLEMSLFDELEKNAKPLDLEGSVSHEEMRKKLGLS